MLLTSVYEPSGQSLESRLDLRDLYELSGHKMYREAIVGVILAFSVELFSVVTLERQIWYSYKTCQTNAKKMSELSSVIRWDLAVLVGASVD